MKSRLVAALLLAWPLYAGPLPSVENPNSLLPEPAASRQLTLVPAGVVGKIEFVGLRRISAAALRAHVSSREGQALDPIQIEKDVRALDRLGWFDSVSAQVNLPDGSAFRPPTGVTPLAGPSAPCFEFRL